MIITIIPPVVIMPAILLIAGDCFDGDRSQMDIITTIKGVKTKKISDEEN
ncbi:MAG: hypothetical protein LBG28_00385 [Tannerella sp.]|jgi:hypothetical protein|nr:hypothetical protein [Tannerella sp.]